MTKLNFIYVKADVHNIEKNASNKMIKMKIYTYIYIYDDCITKHTENKKNKNGENNTNTK